MSGTLRALAQTTRTINAVGGTVRAVGQLAADVAGLAGLPFALDGGAGGLPLGFAELLQPASWRGQPFAVVGTRVRAGRRLAVHEYPMRDGAWVEDLGQRGRIFGFDGFLLGDDVGEQIKALVASVEQGGAGELVHPTFGSRQVEILDFEAGEQWDEGRVWRFRLECLEGRPRGLQLAPFLAVGTQAGVGTAADAAAAASSASFLQRVGAGLAVGYSAAQQAVHAAQAVTAVTARLAGDAARVVNSVRALDGNFGRYGSGRASTQRGVVGELRTVQQVAAGVHGALSAANATTQTVVAAGRALSGLVGA